MQSQEKMNFIQYACIIIDFLACLVTANKCLLLNINLIRYDNNLVTFFFQIPTDIKRCYYCRKCIVFGLSCIHRENEGGLSWDESD